MSVLLTCVEEVAAKGGVVDIEPLGAGPGNSPKSDFLQMALMALAF